MAPQVTVTLATQALGRLCQGWATKELRLGNLVNLTSLDISYNDFARLPEVR